MDGVICTLSSHMMNLLGSPLSSKLNYLEARIWSNGLRPPITSRLEANLTVDTMRMEPYEQRLLPI